MKIFQRVMLVLALLIGAATYWVNTTTDKANKLKDEASLELNAANAATVSAAEKVGAIEEKEFPADRDAIAPLANEAVKLLDASVGHYRAAAEKMRAASEAAADETVKAYFGLEADHLAKLADVKAKFSERTKTYVDDSVKTFDDLATTLGKIDEDLTKLMEEEDSLEKKAQEYAGAHKDKITLGQE